MEASDFDTLAKVLATASLSRARVLSGLVAGGVALAGALRVMEPGAAKQKHQKERQVCVCGADGTVGSCRTQKQAKNKIKKTLRSNPCAYRGACHGVNPCAIVCPAGQKGCNGNCIPSNQCCTGSDCPAASPNCCGGACVNVLTDARNCGSCGNDCGPPETSFCLRNGSCAQQCVAAPSTCPAGCICTSSPNTEGAAFHCIIDGQVCADLPTCTSTSDCPTGSQCQGCISQVDLRCVELCAS